MVYRQVLVLKTQLALMLVGSKIVFYQLNSVVWRYPRQPWSRLDVG